MALIKSALEKSNYKPEVEEIYESPPLCIAIRFDRKPKIADRRIFIGKNIKLFVSSPSLTLVTSIYNGLISIKEFPLYGTKVTNPHASYIKEHAIRQSSIVFATLSPIIIRHRHDKDRYVLPREDGFMESLLNSLSEEWLLYNTTDLKLLGDIKIDLLKFKKVVMTHYGGLVLGFSGLLRMTSPPSILKFFYQSGIGYRRSSGFGFVEVDRL